MARKSHDDGGGGQEWMNTYSDLVTLLMTFFVLLFSMSTVDAEKWEAFVKAFTNPGEDIPQIVIDAQDHGGDSPLTNNGDANQLAEGINPTDTPTPLPTDFDDLYAFLQKYIDENNLGESIEVMKNGDSVVYIRFQNNIFFAPDKSDLLPQGLEVLGYLGDCLAAVQDQIYVVSINGHTADVNQEDYAVSEWMLSGERASRVAEYLDNEKDVDPTKLRPMGYGKSFPVGDNSTEEGREQNRRVDMTIVREEGQGSSQMEQQLASLFDPTQFPKSGGTQDIFDPSLTLGTEELPENLEDVLQDAASAAAEPQAPASSGGTEIPFPSSTGGETPPAPESSGSGGEVIPPPASSAAPPPASSTGGAVIPPPSSAPVGELQTAPIAGTQD